MKQYDNYLVGHYGMRNSGDDALLCASHWGASQFFGGTTLVSSYRPVAAGIMTQNRATLTEHQKFRGQNRLEHYRNAMKCKRVIFGGGRLVHSANDLSVKRHLLRVVSRSQSMALGVGLGPFNRVEDEKRCASFLNLCGTVCVRDKQSYDTAVSLAPHANVNLTFDLAHALRAHPEFTLNTGPRRGILINACPVPVSETGETDYEMESRRAAMLADVITRLWDEYQQPVSLLVMNSHPVWGDSGVLNAIRAQVPERVSLGFIPYMPNTLQLVRLFSHFKLVISMRLHGSVFAHMAETPAFSLNYQSKCSQWCDQVGAPESMSAPVDELDTDALVDLVGGGLEIGFPVARLSPQAGTERSLLNWRYANESTQNFSRYSAV